MDLEKAMKKAGKIEFLLLDADGVLTDGSLYYGPEGEALKRFDVRDGAAIKWMQRAGFQIGVLTGRESPQVEARARELGIDIVIQGAIRKLPIFKELLQKYGLSPEKIAYIGDDIHDLPVLKRVGLAMAPADAIAEVIEVVDWVSAKNGGYGVVREACELILKASGKWEEITAIYRG